MKTIIAEINGEIQAMWDDYGQLYGGTNKFMIHVDPDHIHRTLTKLKVAVIGRSAIPLPEVHITRKDGRSYDTGEVCQINVEHGWQHVIGQYAWQWAAERWDGPRAGQGWQVHVVTMHRKAVKTFLGRGMYLPPTFRPGKPAPSAAEVQAGKIRRLEERRDEWIKKSVRADAAIKTIDRKLRGYELARKRHQKGEHDNDRMDDVDTVHGAGGSKLLLRGVDGRLAVR